MNFEIQRNFEPKKTVLSVSYRYVTLFNILFSVLSLVVAFIVGASLHYDQLTTTSCYRVSNTYFSTLAHAHAQHMHPDVMLDSLLIIDS